MEHEIWGVLPDQNSYQGFLDKFGRVYGEPKLKRRFAICFWDPQVNPEVDTRIRITDGIPELMQKVGRWENHEKMAFEEINLPLPLEPNHLLNMYKTLRNNIPLTLSPRILRFNNSLFKNEEYEIKLTHQPGKQERYTFEVECLNNHGLNLLTFAKEIKLKQYITQTNAEFWAKWDEEMNVFTDDLSEKELLILFEQELAL